MTWFKVDNQLHDHRKSRKAGKAAMGVWVLAGSWSMANRSDGFVPADVLSRWGTPADAGRLVAAGLWSIDEHEGEPGWRFHDWSDFQPSAAVTAAVKEAEAEAGRRGNHKRWHADRKVTDPDCAYCYRVPDHPPDEDPDGEPESGGESGSDRTYPYPIPNTSPNGDVGSPEPASEARRDDVERVCTYLADAVAENGSKRPNITKGWRDEARRMLDLDGRTELEILRAIDWCQRGDSERSRFWRPNVMSMTKLRSKFDQMRLQAADENRKPVSNVQRHLQLAQQLAERESGPQPPQPRQIGSAT